MHGVLDVVLGSCADAAGRSGIPLNYERRTVCRHVAPKSGLLYRVPREGDAKTGKWLDRCPDSVVTLPSCVCGLKVDDRMCAQVAELVDALASGASVSNGVEVRVLSWAPA